MWSVTINFEIHFKSVLETTGLLAILMVAAILLVTRGYRRFFKPLRNERCHDLDGLWLKKPVPEENEEYHWGEVSMKDIY